MSSFIGVRLKKAGKILYFDSSGMEIKVNQNVIVETARGIEYGYVVIGTRENNNDEQQLKKIIRIATKEDEIQHNKNNKKAKEAFEICLNKIAKHNLGMKLIDVELTFDCNKIIFYFTAEGRIDFRALVKDLASIFKTRIELRQIGVRDESKMLNGIGTCGRCLCCSTFLGEFQPVSIKMAKDQNLSLNPTKISGTCGRLMCCLKYEQDTYEELNEFFPNEGDIINTPQGTGEVLMANPLRQTIKAAVRKKPEDSPIISFFNINEIKIIQRIKVKDEQIDKEELKDILD